MKSLALGVAALLCAYAVDGHAQTRAERPFFAGVELGRAELHRNYPGSYVGPRRDSDATAWRLRFGYQLTRSWAVEVGFTDFGEYDGSSMVILQPNVAPGDFITSVKGIDVSAVGTHHLGEHFYLQGTAGLMRREFKTVYSPSMPGFPGYRGKDGDIALQVGAGLGYAANEWLDVVLNWTASTQIDGDLEFYENDADPGLVTLGVKLRF